MLPHLFTRPHQSGKEDGGPYSQEYSNSCNAYYRPDGEVRFAHKMIADAISYQQIEDDQIQHTRKQAR